LADRAVPLPLRELTFDDCVEFVRTALDAADLPVPIVAAIHAKTHGNPLFLEEVVYSLQTPGTLERILCASSIAQSAELAALAVPDRVQGLLMSRVDSAPPSERDLLKVAAVVGQEFTAATLRALPSRAVAGSLDDSLAGLGRAALIVPLADGAYRFQHALLQEVTYDSLPYQRRRQIHAEVAAVLEAATEHPGHGLLVHHYLHAGDDEQTRAHAVRASESSQAVYAFQEAADYLAIALDTVQDLTPDHACLRSRLEELAGDCLESLARHDEAIEDYIRARRRWMSPLCRAAAPRALAGISPLADPEARESDLCWKVARCVEREHKGYRRALRWLQAADETLPPGRNELASRLDVTRGVIFFRLGDLQRSLESCEEGLALARRGDDERAQAYALAMLASPLVGLGRYERAIEATQEAVGLYERVADLAGQASGHGNLAACYQFVGDLRRSLHHHDVSLELNRRLSYRTGTSIVHNNIAEVLLQLGRTDEAVEHLRQVVDRWEERKTPPALVGFALVNLSRALLRTHHLAAATEALDEGRRILTRIRAEGLLMEADLQQARLLLAEHRTDEAGAVCRKLVDAARLSGARLAEVQALCLSGTAEASAGDRAVAEQHLRAAIGLADELGAEYEKAVALAALARLFATAPQPGGQSPHEPLSDAIDLFRRIGAECDLQEACGLRDRCAAHSPG
jgi:tetratricopeptide (TPR) repeat protein